MPSRLVGEITDAAHRAQEQAVNGQLQKEGGQAYSESPSTAFGASAQKRAGKVHEDCHKTAENLDAKLGTHADATEPVGTKMDPCNSGRVSGFVVGAFGGVSMQVRDLADLVACELNAERLALFDDAMNESKQMFTQQTRRSI